MKKWRVILAALAVAMMAAVSCKGSPAPKPPASEISPPPAGPAAEYEIEDEEIENEETEDIANEPPEFDNDFDSDFEIAGQDEPVLAEEEPLAEDDLLAEGAPEFDEAALPEEEPPAVAAAPELPAVTPAPPPPPPVTPPRVTAPPPAAPRPAPAPPAATPRPAAPAPAAPPAAAPPPEPPPAPPAPPPRINPDEIPELPNPTTAFRGRQDDDIVFSRVVRATAGQLVVVPFRGTGWVYLGEAKAQRGIVYDSRRLDPEGQSFMFRAEEAGDYALKFYRQDFIRDFILNDYVQVIVGNPAETAGAGWFNPPIDRGRVTAEPRWPSSLEEARALRADVQPSRPAPAPAGTVPAGTAPAGTAAAPTPAPAAPPAPVQPQAPPPAAPPAQQPQSPPPPAPAPAAAAQPPAAAAQPQSSPPATAAQPQAPAAPLPPEPPIDIPLNLDPDEYLKRAQEEFNAGRVAAAIAYLDRFRDLYALETDELLWLYGQFYEANGPSRNVLAALDCYRRLTREYPQSSRYDAARRRIAYLQRYYINIQ